MDKRVYWATKSKRPMFEAITFDHPSFDAPIRLVANQFAPVTLGGQVHTPAAMAVKVPDQKGDAQPKLTLGFPRQVVGNEFKRQLAKIKADRSRAPIRVRYAAYLGDVDAPQITWDLYAAEAGGISFSNTAVQVTATDSNPMRQAVAPTYDPNVFTGLIFI